jgi:hypothetical protein
MRDTFRLTNFNSNTVSVEDHPKILKIIDEVKLKKVKNKARAHSYTRPASLPMENYMPYEEEVYGVGEKSRAFKKLNVISQTKTEHKKNTRALRK